MCCNVLLRVTVRCIVAALCKAMGKTAMLCTVKVVLRRVAVCCGVLQCVAVCCNVLLRVAECCNLAGLFTAMQQVSLQQGRKQDALCRKVKVLLQGVAGVAMCCRVLQSAAGCRRELLRIAVCYDAAGLFTAMQQIALQHNEKLSCQCVAV